MSLLFSLLACDFNEEETVEHDHDHEHDEDTLLGDVYTSESQSAMTGDQVIQLYREGNQRYRDNELTHRDLPAQVRATTGGQYPEAVVLSCIDSRVPVEYVFDRGVGDVFVARVAGNVINDDILGSMEYACKVAGSKLVLVMGHEGCGAVKAAIDDVELGNVTSLLNKVNPAINNTEHDGEKSSKDKAFVDKVIENNVLNSIEEIKQKSSILKEMEENGDIVIAGAVYQLSDGSVRFLEDEDETE